MFYELQSTRDYVMRHKETTSIKPPKSYMLTQTFGQQLFSITNAHFHISFEAYHFKTTATVLANPVHALCILQPL